MKKINFEKLISDIEAAKSSDEIKEIKEKSGYCALTKEIHRACKIKWSQFKKEALAKRRKERYAKKKNDLKTRMGEKIFFIGTSFKGMKKNEKVTLDKINRTRAYVTCKRGFCWSVPLAHLDIEKDTTQRMYFTEKGIIIK